MSAADAMDGTRHEALLLDIGYVILELSWTAVAAYDAALGDGDGDGDAAVGTGDGDGSDQPPPDRSLRPDDYWDRIARERGMDGFLALFRDLAAVVPDRIFVPAAVALMRDARAAGHPVGVLTNDAYAFLGRDFFVDRPEFADLDAFVDATEIGARKPAAEAYLAAADALATPVERIVFLDDTPECVDGGRAVGMTALLVDPYDRAPAFAEARELLALAPAAPVG